MPSVRGAVLADRGISMGEITEGVNWLAVGVGTVLSFLLGWLWYSPKLFGTKWAAGIGVELGSVSAMPMAAMGFQLLATFLLAWVVGVMETRQAFVTMVLIVAAIVVFIVANGQFARKSRYAIMVEAGFVAAMGVLMFGAQVIL